MRRMKRIRSILRAIATGGAALAALTIASSTARAADEAAAGMPGDWLSRYASARSIGLGGAFVAMADDFVLHLRRRHPHALKKAEAEMKHME